MDETTKRALQTAYQLIQQGRKEAAFSLLASVVKANPEIADAWYLLGFAVDEPQKKRYAFQQVLRINPAHEGAQKQMARLLQPPQASVRPSAPTGEIPSPASAADKVSAPPIPAAQTPESASAAVSVSPHRQPVAVKPGAPTPPARKKPTSRAWLWVSAGVFLFFLLAAGTVGMATGALPALFFPTPTRTARPPTPRPTAVLTPTHVYPFRATGCPFDVPLGTRVKCGVVKVPQDRTAGSETSIEIPVVVYRSSKPNAEAIVFLQGGPGVESINWSLAWFDEFVSPLLEEYDMIFFDPRGTGRSLPRLDCPELNEIYLDAFFQTRSEEESFQSFTSSWKRCSQQFQSKGIQPAAFNTTESAADVRDIVKALGYEKVNLLGISYGTRLALTILRDSPDIIRAAVLDSVVPMQRKMINQRSADMQYALDKLFSDCANSPACNSAYPDLRNKFEALVTRFQEQPVMVKLRDPNTGFVYDAPVNGVELVGAVIEGMRYSSLLPVIPKAIYDIEKGDYTFLSFALGVSGSNLNAIDMGTYFSTLCHEQVYATTPEEMQAALTAPPVIQKFATLSIFGEPRRVFELCNAWGARPYNSLNAQPVTSDIPTLILAGEYDPTTPITTAEMVASDLPNDHFYVIRGMGHAATVGNACSLSIVKSFLQSPNQPPDTRCLESIANFEFFLPYDGRPVTFVPAIEPSLKMRGIVPQGWRKETVHSVYYRRAYLFDPTLAMFNVLPLNKEQAFQALSENFNESGFDEPAKKIETRQGKGLEWTIYTTKFNGEPVFVGLAEVNWYRTVILIMVVSAPEQEASYQNLFFPMLDALEVW